MLPWNIFSITTGCCTQPGPIRSRPIDTVRVNLNDMLGYGEVAAGDLYTRITALLDSEAFCPTGSLVDAAYREKIAQVYAVASEE